MRNILFAVVVLVALGAVFAFTLQHIPANISPASEFPNQSRVATTTAALHPDLYPLYDRVQWEVATQTTVDGADAMQLHSVLISNVTNIATNTLPFTTYYQDKLTNNGWVLDQSREAGGPGAESSTYRKGNDFVVISFHSIFHVQSDDAPEQCPCDLQFTLTSGTQKSN